MTCYAPFTIASANQSDGRASDVSFASGSIVIRVSKAGRVIAVSYLRYLGGM